MSDPITQERQLASWEEPSLPQLSLGGIPQPLALGGAALIIAIMIGVAFWQHDYSIYLAAAVVIAGIIAFLSQNRRPARARQIVLTTARLVVGRHEYPLAELAGFWLEKQPEFTAINVEPQKVAMVPITFLYPSSKLSEVHDILIQAMPELEPRQKNVSDSINRYIGG